VRAWRVCGSGQASKCDCSPLGSGWVQHVGIGIGPGSESARGQLFITETLPSRTETKTGMGSGSSGAARHGLVDLNSERRSDGPVRRKRFGGRVRSHGRDRPRNE